MKEVKNKIAKKPVAKKTVAEKTVAVVKQDNKTLPVEKKECCCHKSMIDHYVGVIDNYFKFKGRLCRRGYWSFFLFNGIFEIVFALLDALFSTGGVLLITYLLLTIIPAIAAICRRLHDTGHSFFCFGVIPFLIIPAALEILWGLEGTLKGSLYYNMMVVVAYIDVVWMLITHFMLIKPSAENNKYGEKPCC